MSKKSEIRINKYLSDRQICSRRQADRLIEKGLVLVNGKKAVLGQKLSPADKVTLKNEARVLQSKYKYYIYNKPVGIVSHKTAENEREAREVLKLPKDFAPVGRLDKTSEGLLFLSNDGRIVDRMLNPKYKHEKEYMVWVDKNIKNRDIKRLQTGVDIEGYLTRPARAEKLSERKLRIVLYEGKKHQIRRMLAALGYVVKRLKRVRIMNLKLGDLRVGQVRELSEEEKRELSDNLSIKLNM